MKIRIYLSKTNKLSYPIVIEGLSGKKISDKIQLVHSDKSCDLEIDCEYLFDKEQFDKAKPAIFKKIWEVYHRINAPRQKNQKKVRLKNREN